MSTGVIAYCIVIAARQGLFTPHRGANHDSGEGVLC
jgi:hypothetical protein